MSDSQTLYLWFDRDPEIFDPDHSIEDTPGVADIDLLTAAIMDGELGEILPARIFMATHSNPKEPRTVRSIDVGRLLRDIGVQHRRCYQISLPDRVSEVS
jgi:hypothetical protein